MVGGSVALEVYSLWLRVWGWVEIEATVRIWGVGSNVGDGDFQCLGIVVLSL